MSMRSESLDQIHVISHVARDLLQTAAVFKTDKQVVWEYVSNGLQYSRRGIPARVVVNINLRKKSISVADNGRGMDWKGLQNFWTMHGENLDRLAGRPGRGRFGTGKAAAFGIADVLRITSVRGHKRSSVQLRRADVEGMGTGDPIPVHTLSKEDDSDEDNGTRIEIEGIRLRQVDQTGIIKYIERHLAHWPKDSTVIVNSHLCEYTEPPVAATHTFVPSKEEASLLGHVTLQIKVSKAVLEDELRGIAVFSKGVWHESTLAGAEKREMSQYIFGEIDVPAIEEDKSPIAAFDHTRSLQLNRENELVRTLFAFVGRSVETVRQQLLETERERRRTEEAKRLARQASAIADVLNDDFAEFSSRLAKVKAKSTGATDLGGTQAVAGKDSSDIVPGGELPGRAGPLEQWHTPVGRGQNRGGTTGRSPSVDHGEKPQMGQPAGGAGDKRRARGGFTVSFKPLGQDFDRSQYAPDERTIYINLDHPQVVAARGDQSDKDPTFRRLAYEIAFTEYSVALAYEMNNRDEYSDPSEPIFDIRQHINRLARRAAALYQEQ
jgi:hypothetical protein